MVTKYGYRGVAFAGTESIDEDIYRLYQEIGNLLVIKSIFVANYYYTT